MSEKFQNAFNAYILNKTALPRAGYSLFESKFPEAGKKGRKFVAGINVDGVNSAMDFGRGIVDKIAGPETIERKEKRQEQEDYLNDFFNHLYGEDIIERTDRYGLSSSTVEPMDTMAGELAQAATSFVVGFKGVDKLLKGPKAFEKGSKTNKFFRKNPITRNIVAGEAATQVAFDPTEGTLIPELIGSVLPENDGMLEDIKSYLEMEADDPDRDRLTDRMLLLADGLAFVGGFAALGKGAGYVNRQTGFSKAFVEMLNKIRVASKETKDNFIQNIQKSKSENAKQIRTAEENRKFERTKKKVADEPVVTGKGDIEAFAPSKYSLFEISAQFAENPLMRTLEKIRRKGFTSRGLRTNRLYERFLKTENLKEMHQDRVANIAFNLESTIDDIVKKSGQASDKLKEQINYVLFTDFRSPTIITGGKISLGRTQASQFKKELNKLPEELRDPIIRAREYQDKLSKLLIDTNYLTPEMKKIFADNLGFYVRRSYKAFEDVNFKPSNDVKKRAEEYIRKTLKQNNPKLTNDKLDLQVSAVMKNFEEVGKGSSFSANLETFDRVRKEILKNKKEIPKPIRELLGEITDPTEAIIHSTTKLAKLMEDAKFYDGAFQDGIGIYIRREQEGIFKEVIPEGFGPLSGKYTSKEMLSYFNGYKGLTNALVNNEYIGGIYTNLMYLKGFSQAAKTIYSHTTHVKNVAGGVQMSLANGINVFDVKQSKEIIDILRARTKSNKDRQEFHELLSELGLLNKGVVARDLQGLAGDLATRKKGFIAGNIDWAADKIGLKKLANKAQNAYIAEDDFFKINMFIREEKNLKKINDLLPETLQKSERQIQEEAAKIVRSVLPNYDLVPEFFKQVRAVPFMGRFFSFMSESVRISYGTIMQGRKEFQEYLRLSRLGNNEAANEYLKRSARRIGSFTAMAGTGAAAAEKVSQAVTGLSDAEMEAYKDFLPDYMRNSRIAVAVSEDGVPMIGNLSSWDAYDYPKKVIKLIGKDFYNTEVDNEKFSTDLLNNLFREAVSPFLGESMIGEPLLDYFAADGKTKTGTNMSYQFLGDRYEYIDYGDPTANKLGNLNILFGKLMTETLLPGSVDRLVDYTQTFGKDQTRYDQNIYETDQFIKFVTGWGMSPMNEEYLENIHGFKSSDYSKMKSQHRNNISNGIGDVLEYEKFIDNYIDVNMLHYKNFAKYTKFNESAELLGLNTTKLMYEHNISRNDRGYIRQGRYKPLTVTEDMRDKMRKRDENKVLNEIMPDIYRIDRILGDMPVLYDDNHYKVFKEDLEAVEEKVEEIKEKTRLELKTGGRVLNVEEDPIDRTNPFTGNTYSQDAERLGFFAGGSSNVITQAFKKAMQLSLGTTALVASEPVQATEQYKKYMGQYEYKPRKMFNEGAKVSLTPEEQYVEFYNMAVAAGLDYPDAVAAQASLESGHGKSELATKYNNPLGIKVNRPSEIKQGQQSVKMDTQEFFKGKEGTYKEPFRVYNNLAESFVGYKEKISAPRYNSIREAKNSDEYLINIDKAGYATDPKYAEKTINIKNRYAYLIKE